MVRVTIGLPFKSERESHFMMAVRSVFAQTFADWELVLVADGADASLIDIARRITDPRVTLIEHERSVGLAASLNEITRAARADVLVRMDADDIMSPDRVAHVEEYLAAHPDVDVVASRLIMIDQDDVVRGVFREPPLPEQPVEFLRSNALSHPAVAGRTEWFGRNPYNPAFLRAEDKELWVRTAGHSSFAKIDDTLMFYRVAFPLSARKQALDSRWDRTVLRSYASAQVGFVGAQVLLTKSLFKQVMFSVVGVSPLRRRLYERKASALPPREGVAASAALARVREARVNGWLDWGQQA